MIDTLRRGMGPDVEGEKEKVATAGAWVSSGNAEGPTPHLCWSGTLWPCGCHSVWTVCSLIGGRLSWPVCWEARQALTLQDARAPEGEAGGALAPHSQRGK